MGLLGRLKTLLGRTRKVEPEVVRASDDAADTAESVSRLDNLGFPTGQRVVSRVGDDLQAGTRRYFQSGAKAYGTRAGAGAALGGLGLGGAWVYSSNAQKEEEEAKTRRYNEYQSRLEEIEQMYADGDISRSEMAQLKEQARKDYYQSIGRENYGKTIAEILAEMGTLKLLALAAFVSALGLYTLRPLIRKLDVGAIGG